MIYKDEKKGHSGRCIDSDEVVDCDDFEACEESSSEVSMNTGSLESDNFLKNFRIVPAIFFCQKLNNKRVEANTR